MNDRPSRILARLWLALTRRIVPSLNLDMFYIFLGIRYGSSYLLLVLAKEDLSLWRLELRLLFFALLIPLPFLRTAF